MKKVLHLLLCTLSMYGMKQKKLIKKVLKHERGVSLINTILEETKKVALPYKTHLSPSKTFLEAIKNNRLAIFNRLSYDFSDDHSVVRESGGSLASSLVFPCPDTFMATIKPLVTVTDNHGIMIDHAAYEESKKHQIVKDEKDYTELALKYPEIFLAIDVYPVNNIDSKKIFVYDQFMKFYDFESVKNIVSRNPKIFAHIRAEQLSSTAESDIRSAYKAMYDKIKRAIARDEVGGKTSLGDIYTCEDKEFYLNIDTHRLNDYCDMVHKSKRWKKQEKIINKMRKDPRRFILFEGQTSAYLKNHAWKQNNLTDQTMIQEWGGSDIISVLEPYNELYDESLHDHSLYGQVKLLKEQQDKTYRDYATVKQKATRLVTPEFFTSNQPISLEEATILEDNGFYGITGLHSRKR